MVTPSCEVSVLSSIVLQPRTPEDVRPGLRRGPRPAYLSGVTPPVPSFPEDPIDRLTSKQRAHLRSLGHHEKAILQIGADGVTPAVLESVEEAFNNRELLKVKVLDLSPADVDETADAVRDGMDGVYVVQTIGKTMLLYRPFPEEPEIELP